MRGGVVQAEAQLTRDHVATPRTVGLVRGAASRSGFAFTGTIPAQSSLTVTMTRSAMLNNTGDAVGLVSPSAAEGPHLTYTSAQARLGDVVVFGN